MDDFNPEEYEKSIGTTLKPSERTKKFVENPVVAGVRGFAKGTTAGLSERGVALSNAAIDELGQAMNQLPERDFLDAYNDYIKFNEATYKMGKEASPKASTIGEIAGVINPKGLFAKLLKGLKSFNVTSKLAPLVEGGGATAAYGQVERGTYKDKPYSVGGTEGLASDLALGMVGQYGGDKLAKAASKGADVLRKTFQKAPVTTNTALPTTLGERTGSKWVLQLESYLEGSPNTSGKFAKIRQKQGEYVQGRVKDIQNQIGGGSGAELQEQLMRTKRGLNTAYGNVYDKTIGSIANEKAVVDKTVGFLEKELSRAGALKNGKYTGKLNTGSGGYDKGTINEMVQYHKSLKSNPTVQELRDVQQKIKGKGNYKEEFPSYDERGWRFIDSSIGNDIDKSIETYAGDSLKKSYQTMRKVYSTKRPVVEKMVKKAGPQKVPEEEAIAKIAGKRNASELEAVKQTLSPRGFQQVKGGIVDDLFDKSLTLSKDGEKTYFNAIKFKKQWDGMTDRAKDVLFSADEKKMLNEFSNDVGVLGSGARAYTNWSNTGRYNEFAKMLGSADPIEGSKQLMKMYLSKKVGNLVTSPELEKVIMSKWGGVGAEMGAKALEVASKVLPGIGYLPAVGIATEE